MKMIILAVTVLILKYPPRTMLLVLFSLFQVGEFSLLLSGVGKDSGIIPENIYQYFLAISIISMGLTPFLIANAEKFTYAILKLPISSAVRKRLENIKKAPKLKKNFPKTTCTTTWS